MYKLFSALITSHGKLFRFLRPYRLSCTAVNDTTNRRFDHLPCSVGTDFVL